MERDIWEIIEQVQGDIAAEIRVMLGEAPYAENLFDLSQRQRRIEALKKCAALSTTDEERHESWLQMHREAGWVHGEQFDPEAKTHPNMLPWAELPATAKSKAKIFDILAKAAVKLGAPL